MTGQWSYCWDSSNTIAAAVITDSTDDHQGLWPVNSNSGPPSENVKGEVKGKTCQNCNFIISMIIFTYA